MRRLDLSDAELRRLSNDPIRGRAFLDQLEAGLPLGRSKRRIVGRFVLPDSGRHAVDPYVQQQKFGGQSGGRA